MKESGLPTLVLIDIDGTLVHTGGAGRFALERMFVELFNVDGAFDSYSFSGKTDQQILADAFATWFDRKPTQEELEAARDRYLELLVVALDETAHLLQLCPGIPELLDALEERNVPMGLATGNLKEGSRHKLEAANLWHRFPFGGFGSDAIDRAELTTMGANRGRALAGYPIPDDRVFVIGDSNLDIDAARRSNFQSIAVATGWHPKEDLLVQNPDHFFDDLSDTAAVLKAMGLH